MVDPFLLVEKEEKFTKNSKEIIVNKNKLTNIDKIRYYKN
jgi:hypothetical protein